MGRLGFLFFFFLFSLCLLEFLQFFCLVVVVDAKANNRNQLSLTPINRDLYHSGEDLMEEIKALVNRHPDKLLLETVKSGNRDYQAEVKVVTYCRRRQESDDRSKFRILLMIPCLPEFRAAWKGAYYI